MTTTEPGPRHLPVPLASVGDAATSVVGASTVGAAELVGELPAPDALATAIAVTDALDSVLALGPQVHRDIVDAAGLRWGELRVLGAVAADLATVDDVASALGEHPDAVRATLASLARTELVAVGVDLPDEVRITEAGRTRVDQVAALRVRRLATVPEPVGRRVVTAIDEVRARVTRGGGTGIAPLHG